jgi:hypothetical protein
MSWFEDLTGFRETSPEQVRRNLTLDGETLLSKVNGRVMVCGRLETPALSELRERVRSGERGKGKLSVREVIANVQDLHADRSNAAALFQVASQFNLLEMASPNVTPEYGVGIYENDPTQGPACAVAAGAGTIYRNYFALVNGQTGQSASKQIDCLADLGKALGNTGSRLWQMRNGYALATRHGLIEIADHLRVSAESELDELRGLLRIGLQWNTQVTLEGCNHRVSQAYCSALPVAYSNHAADLWEGFARLVLEASYEATICSAILNWRETGNRHAFLTLLGGGAFGNRPEWILDALRRALVLYASWGLDVAIVSYRRSNPGVQALVEGLK